MSKNPSQPSHSTELCMFGQLDVGVTHLFKHFGLKPLQLLSICFLIDLVFFTVSKDTD